jgi:hypothetical protein
MQDSGTTAFLAGYGKYYRMEDKKTLCQTDEYGRNKFHMCAKTGNSDQICKQDQPPTSSQCSKFFDSVQKTVPEEYEEIKIVDMDSKKEAFCFPSHSPNPHSNGWCETDMNFYEFKAHKEKGWGFCGKDCYLGKFDTLEDFGVLRHLTTVNILQDKLCNVFLKEASEGIHLKVKPKILCVGEFRPWKTQLWKKKGQLSFINNFFFLHYMYRKHLLKNSLKLKQIFY